MTDDNVIQWHENAKGQLVRCPAKIQCRLGGQHFPGNTPEEAETARETFLAKHNPTIAAPARKKTVREEASEAKVAKDEKLMLKAAESSSKLVLNSLLKNPHVTGEVLLRMKENIENKPEFKTQMWSLEAHPKFPLSEMSKETLDRKIRAISSGYPDSRKIAEVMDNNGLNDEIWKSFEVAVNTPNTEISSSAYNRELNRIHNLLSRAAQYAALNPRNELSTSTIKSMLENAYIKNLDAVLGVGKLTVKDLDAKDFTTRDLGKDIWKSSDVDDLAFATKVLTRNEENLEEIDSTGYYDYSNNRRLNFLDNEKLSSENIEKINDAYAKRLEMARERVAKAKEEGVKPSWIDEYYVTTNHLDDTVFSKLAKHPNTPKALRQKLASSSISIKADEKFSKMQKELGSNLQNELTISQTSGNPHGYTAYQEGTITLDMAKVEHYQLSDYELRRIFPFSMGFKVDRKKGTIDWFIDSSG